MQTTMRHKLATAALYLAVGMVTVTTPVARAYDLPAVNLGFTSFLDGGPPAGPGFYYTHYFQYYRAESLRGVDGTEIFPNPVFPDAKVDAWISLSQFIAQCPKKLVLGAQPGLDVIVPVVDLGISGTPLRANRAGFGDVLVGPFLQWEPIMGKNGPIFMHRIEFQCLLPVGRYDSRYQLNPGANHFSFNPYWAGTLFITPKLTLSTRLHYLWNDGNEDPDVTWTAHPLWKATGGNEVQPGQALHLNFATDYELIEKRLRVGFNGYYLTQITDTRLNGQNIPQRREEVIGLGPGALFSFSQNTHLFFNAYFETAAENRPEGMRFQLRLVHHF
ncbi:MAG: transporter [Verrucomicrobiae bacterium]|nr:transporter [Verrucomicrobiae bacterium]